jgi:hypothetical protein
MNCFDKDYIIRGAPHRPWATLYLDAIEVLGGPRCRLFSILEQDLRRGWVHYTFGSQLDRFVDKVPLSLMPMLAALWPRTQEAFFKTGLT